MEGLLLSFLFRNDLMMSSCSVDMVCAEGHKIRAGVLKISGPARPAFLGPKVNIARHQHDSELLPKCPAHAPFSSGSNDSAILSKNVTFSSWSRHHPVVVLVFPSGGRRSGPLSHGTNIAYVSSRKRTFCLETLPAVLSIYHESLHRCVRELFMP
jgi:hypothetical protein